MTTQVIIADARIIGTGHSWTMTPTKMLNKRNIDISHIPVLTVGNKVRDNHLLNRLLRFEISVEELVSEFALA